MGTILYLTQPLFFFPLFQFLWLQRANTGFGLAEGAAEFLAGTIIVGGLAILVHSQPGRADRYWRPASCHLTWCRFFMSAVASKWSVFLDYYKNLGLCARAENQKRTEQIFCCTVKMSVASKRRHDHAFLKHVFAEKQLLQGRKYDTISKVKNCRPLPWNAQRIRAAIFLRVPKKQRQSFRLVFFTHLWYTHFHWKIIFRGRWFYDL